MGHERCITLGVCVCAEREHELLYTIEAIPPYGYRLTILATREIREADSIELLLRSLVRDFGYYLRRK